MTFFNSIVEKQTIILCSNIWNNLNCKIIVTVNIKMITWKNLVRKSITPLKMPSPISYFHSIGSNPYEWGKKIHFPPKKRGSELCCHIAFKRIPKPFAVYWYIRILQKLLTKSNLKNKYRASQNHFSDISVVLILIELWYLMWWASI